MTIAVTQPNTKYKQGDSVHVPSELLPSGADYGHAMYGTSVVQVRGNKKRSLKVRLRDGSTSGWIASSRVVPDPSVLLLRIGDYSATGTTEDTLLDPLIKSALQFLRLLLPDDMVFRRAVRSKAELGVLWSNESKVFHNVVLVGHGSKKGIHFGVDGLVTAKDLSSVLGNQALGRSFISLCCLNGYADFAGEFSSSPVCHELIAPFHSVHGAVASQFLQTLLVCRLFQGNSAKVSFRKANECIPSRHRFRRWVDGKHVT